MTLDDLLKKIHHGNYESIEVEHLAYKTGNTGGAGNYSIVRLQLGAEQIEFDNSAGIWNKTP